MVVSQVALKFVGLAVVSFLCDKYTEGSWHSFACGLCFLCHKMFFGHCIEFVNGFLHFLGFNVWLELFIVPVITTTSSCCSLASDCLSFEEIVEIFYKVWARSWMSDENNFSSCVNNSDVWNSLHTKFFVGDTLSISHVVMLNICPFLVFNMALDCGSILIDWKTDQSYLSSPCCSMFLKHLLVVRHWALAWWTPSGPEIKKQDFSCIMSDVTFTWSI
jgi:hypothetical protein